MRFLVILATLILFSMPAIAKNVPLRKIEGMVVKVSDGDTINVDDNGTRVKVRLYGIDAPETQKVNYRTGRVNKPGQPAGNEAWEALNKKIHRKRVQIKVIDVDRYKRLVSLVLLGNRDINREMVAEGWAWAYRQHLDRTYASEYISAEEQARARRLGLWKNSNPQSPWEFRKAFRLSGE